MSNKKEEELTTELHGGRGCYRTKTPWYSVVIFFLLLITACADVINPPPQKKSLPAGYGSFTPILAQDTARTILPATPKLSDFTRFELNFTPVDGQGDALKIERPYAQSVALEPVSLIAGTYNLSVSAYKASGNIAARGTLNNIAIAAAAHEHGTVVLQALFGEGAGTFTWNITLATAPITVNAATMTIKDANGAIQEPIINLLTTSGGDCPLPSGLYTVVFTMEGLQGDQPHILVWNELLHIYAELESKFTITFTAAHFTNTHWNVTFNENYEGGGSQTQSIMHGGTVSALPSVPVRDNYLFNRWNTQADGNGMSFTATTIVTANITVYAQWKLDVFTSVEALRIWLATQDTNTADEPYAVVLNIDQNDITNLRTTLNNAANKYVNIDLSGSGIATIPDLAFRECTSLASVTIPDSVISIGDAAFNSCTSLTSVTIGNSVTSIGLGAFGDCTSLTSVTIGNSVTSIRDWAFRSCTSLTSVTIPNSVTSIQNEAFYNCTSLTSITIPDSVTSIGWGAFSGCTSLISVIFQGTITAENFSSNYTFPGDLRDKYLANGTGTYTRPSGGDTWTKI